MVEHVLVGLAHRMRYQAIAHYAAVDVEILAVRLAAGIGRPGDPAPEPQACRGVLQAQGLLEEAAPGQLADSALPLLRGLGPR